MSEQEKKSKKRFPLWGIWTISSAALLLALFSMLLFSVFPKKVQKNDEQPTYISIVDDESQLPNI
nr:hypothetical protein [Treponema sp.]